MDTKKQFYELVKRAATTRVVKTVQSEHTMETKSTAEQLIEYRKKNKLTQSDLADQIGCAYASIRDWEEKGYIPSYKYREKIEKLGITIVPTKKQRHSREPSSLLGASLQNQRLKLKYSLKEVADKLGVTDAAVSNWEMRTFPNRPELIVKLKQIGIFLPDIPNNKIDRINWKKHFYDKFTLVNMKGKAVGYTGDDWKNKDGEPIKPSVIVAFFEDVLARYGIAQNERKTRQSEPDTAVPEIGKPEGSRNSQEAATGKEKRQVG